MRPLGSATGRLSSNRPDMIVLMGEKETEFNYGTAIGWQLTFGLVETNEHTLTEELSS